MTQVRLKPEAPRSQVKHSTTEPLCSQCHLLITFANSLEPNEARQNVEPDQDPNCLTF